MKAPTLIHDHRPSLQRKSEGQNQSVLIEVASVPFYFWKWIPTLESRGDFASALGVVGNSPTIRVKTLAGEITGSGLYLSLLKCVNRLE